MPQTLLVLAGLTGWAWLDRHSYRALCLVEESTKRRAFYRQWTWVSFVAFGLGGLALLVLVGSLEALRRMPAEFAALRPSFEAPETVNAGSADYLIGVLIGAGLVLGLSAFLWSRRIRKMRMPVIGDIEPLMPRNRSEILSAIPMAISAGVVEELFFRLALPLLAAQVTGSALAGFAIACVAFALVHLYQGWKGMVFVFVAGVWFAWLYLGSGSLLKLILLHILIDLVALVVRPTIGLLLLRRAATV
ncbi:CPBP family intramembrane metalloprotease [Sphingobium sp. AS12]|uniref:CPBP family intramembrane glutamic endopeptidase n=1 Tax=Sphingobium sp. AS12 TaxID=2849495 RepID=UPI001C3138D1|nr:CPBP family intramembrane metalloprotease [Sphingobium sp. AS12]